MRKAHLFILTLVIATLLTSCSMGRMPMVKGIDDVKVSKIAADSVHMDVVLKINNPGTWGFRVKRIDMNVMLNDKAVGVVKGKMPFKLISQGERPYNVTVSASNAAVIGALPDLLGTFLGGGNKQTNLRLVGTIKTRWFIFGKKIQFDSSKDFKMPKLLNGLGGRN
ncbi:MAG: LEA type 2 family protein [Sphingobacteriales bacterium JAD_PAG50586_3]|nr:MAG: LEA type 2 family protein [Sphingobacteriales bacterium JAD_PAG50586_3]